MEECFIGRNFDWIDDLAPLSFDRSHGPLKLGFLKARNTVSKPAVSWKGTASTHNFSGEARISLSSIVLNGPFFRVHETNPETREVLP